MNTSRLLAATCLALVAIAAPAAAQAPPRPLRFVDEGGADKDWAVVQPRMQAPMPAGESHEACVALGYKINRDGTTSDVIILKGWMDGADAGSDPRLSPYAQAAAAAVTQWRFEPKPGASSNRVVFTSVSVAFPRAGGAAADEVRSHCAITGLKAFVTKVQAENKQNQTDANNAELKKMRDANLENRLQQDAARISHP